MHEKNTLSIALKFNCKHSNFQFFKEKIHESISNLIIPISIPIFQAAKVRAIAEAQQQFKDLHEIEHNHHEMGFGNQ